MNVEELARIGYEAYGDNTHWQTFDGRQMPQWMELPQRIRDAWIAATLAIAEGVSGAVLT